MALSEIEELGVNQRHLIGGFCFGFGFIVLFAGFPEHFLPPKKIIILIRKRN